MPRKRARPAIVADESSEDEEVKHSELKKARISASNETPIKSKPSPEKKATNAVDDDEDEEDIIRARKVRRPAKIEEESDSEAALSDEKPAVNGSAKKHERD